MTKYMRDGSKTLDRMRRDPRIEFVDDERTSGNGIIVTLRRGWTFDALCDQRVGGGDTISEAFRYVREIAKPYDGPYTD